MNKYNLPTWEYLAKTLIWEQIGETCGKCVPDFGAIRCFEDGDIPAWCPEFEETARFGARAFYGLQQNQEIQADERQWRSA